MTTPTAPEAESTTLSTRLGKNIAEQRHRRGWTQQELAEQIGVDSVTVSRFETGASTPSLARLDVIAARLEVTLAELVSGISARPAEHAQVIATYLAPLAASDRQLLVETVKQFAERLARR